jgi:hypothetical protein
MSEAGLSFDTAINRTFHTVSISRSGSRSAKYCNCYIVMGVYLSPALVCGIDARGDACYVLCELLGSLGVDLHVFGHGCRIDPSTC